MLHINALILDHAMLCAHDSPCCLLLGAVPNAARGYGLCWAHHLSCDIGPQSLSLSTTLPSAHPRAIGSKLRHLGALAAPLHRSCSGGSARHAARGQGGALPQHQVLRTSPCIALHRLTTSGSGKPEAEGGWETQIGMEASFISKIGACPTACTPSLLSALQSSSTRSASS